MELNERVTETVIRLLADVLPGGMDLTPQSSLREHGLDSISAVRVWFELQREFSLDLPVEKLGECANPAQLAACVIKELDGAPDGGPHGEPREGHSQPVVSADPAGRHEPFPLTPIQQAYLLGKERDLGPDAVGCHLYREFEVDDLDPDRLRAAWGRVVEHHDVLRLIVTADGRQQVRERAPSWDMPVRLRFTTGPPRTRRPTIGLVTTGPPRTRPFMTGPPTIGLFQRPARTGPSTTWQTGFESACRDDVTRRGSGRCSRSRCHVRPPDRARSISASTRS